MSFIDTISRKKAYEKLTIKIHLRILFEKLISTVAYLIKIGIWLFINCTIFDALQMYSVHIYEYSDD